MASSASFSAVTYNTDKIDRGLGELMKVSGFGMLGGLQDLRPEDYRNALKAVSALNRRVKSPQFHATISAEGRSYDKIQLTAIAEKWLQEMGYGDQPYLIVFHGDTANNHVHIVSTRVNRQGKKVNSDFEKLRAVAAMNRIMRQDQTTLIEKAFAYRYSTVAQFRMLLKNMGDDAPLSDQLAGRVTEGLAADKPDPKRVAWLKAILLKYPDEDYLRQKFGIVLIFHASENKPPYGYSIIDHAGKAVYKGSEVLPLKQLLGQWKTAQTAQDEQVHIPKVSLQSDADDEAVHGKKRKKKNKKP
ncbi:relaxase/mobilization nuclease domain-containing protein [Mucilaginibacter corticis]|uniref:relaxase/mobilization nuclease domain-containing protein n=1 Tax=Mucilaginibacter corticis TaxID=2597670 RepID=UPI001642C803|nr:relaxase/mobilization nuclease domain-containing protein [Mucilaginibacter corticis]